MAWKKPKWVQNVQKAADNAVKPITTSAPVKAIQKAVTPPPAPKVIQNIQKAADRVINPITTSAPVKAVQQAAQQAVNTTQQAVAQAPAKALQAVQNVAQNIPSPTAPLKSENNGIQEVMPYFTKILPNAVGDVVRGTGRATAGVLTADADKITSGAGMVGRGAWSAAKNGVIGALPFFNAATTTTEPTMGGGRSGGAATTAIPVGEEDTDDVLPPGAKGNSKIGVPREPESSPIPPTPVVGGYLTGQLPKRKLSSVKMPKRYKARKK